MQMRKSNKVLSVGILMGTMACMIMWSAKSVGTGQTGALLRLQPTSPGIPQSGNVNVQGTIIGSRLGIGTQPQYALQVSGTIFATSSVADLATTQGEAIQFGHFSGGTFFERMRVDANGGIGINTTTPDGALDINGNLHLTGGRTKIYYRGDLDSQIGALGIYGFSGGSIVVLDPYSTTGNLLNSTIRMGGFGNFNSNTVNLEVSGSVLAQSGVRFANGTVQTSATPNTEFGCAVFDTGGTFTVPNGVTRLRVEAWGGGGGGSSTGFGYGGPGAYARCVITVTPGQQIVFSVGSGGVVGQVGGNTAFASVVAGGGMPGLGDQDGSGGVASGPNGILRNGQFPLPSFAERSEFGIAGYGGTVQDIGEEEPIPDPLPGEAGQLIIEW